MARLITEQPHENYQSQDSPWGHHFVPFSVEVMGALIRGVHRGQGKDKCDVTWGARSGETDLPSHKSIPTYLEIHCGKEAS